jgi:hypothetical protein
MGRALLTGWLIILAWQANAEPAIDSGDAMLPFCKKAIIGQSSGPVPPEAWLCLGKIDSLRRIRTVLKEEFASCAPDSVTNDQALRVVVKYLEENPKFLHQHFDLLALIAMQDAWPCKK